MLREAEDKRARQPPEAQPRANFRAADIRSLDLGRRFDLVLAPFYLLNHLLGEADQAQAVARIAAHVAPGGLAVLHCLGEAWRERAPPRGAALDIDVPAQGLVLRAEIVEGTRGADMRIDTVFRFLLSQDDGTPLNGSVERLRYRMLLPETLRRMVEDVGLIVEEEHRAFPGNDVDTELVMVCRG